MKTTPYRKNSDTEGYDGKPGIPTSKTDVEKTYEGGNDTQKVTSFGNEPIATKNNRHLTEDNIVARDGFDNTGTQGKDSLSDDAYPQTDEIETKESAQGNTGSATRDFEN